MKRKICFLIVFVVLAMSTNLTVFANDYDQSFIEVYGLDSIGTSDAMSPLRKTDFQKGNGKSSKGSFVSCGYR